MLLALPLRPALPQNPQFLARFLRRLGFPLGPVLFRFDLRRLRAPLLRPRPHLPRHVLALLPLLLRRPLRLRRGLEFLLLECGLLLLFAPRALRPLLPEPFPASPAHLQLCDPLPRVRVHPGPLALRRPVKDFRLALAVLRAQAKDAPAARRRVRVQASAPALHVREVLRNARVVRHLAFRSVQEAEVVAGPVRAALVAAPIRGRSAVNARAPLAAAFPRLSQASRSMRASRPRAAVR